MPSETEAKWYHHWKERKYFASVPDDRESFTIVIPPPNVTGVLHMGHMLNNTIQDVLIRKARLDGKNACWVPGTDHASIATEAKVVAHLRKKGIKKSDLTREEFLEHAWEWKEKYGGIILKQLEKLGASCDWDRTAFTMDEVRSDHVIKAFVDLYHNKKLYRKKRMVNWDPEALTVLSNEEVIYQEETDTLCHVRYRIKDSDEFVVIATTRPETIMGDTAVAVHPDDKRYHHLKGKKAIVPLVDREVPIVFDDYVEMDFGTGALKVTPAHDVNDYEIGLRHNLEIVDVLNPDGTMSEAAQIYIGMPKEEARKRIVKDLQDQDLLVKIEDLVHNVGRSERTQSIVEPRLSLQWYVDMKALAKPALEAVESDEVEFFPKNQKNLYRHWMENIRDWCISRQLWWGHRIPAWYLGDEVFVAVNAEEALLLARKQLNKPDLTLDDLVQDEDVLDTWFSSWLWPISLFNGFNDRREMDYYYPTSVLVTGWDIIFLWVARMIMAGYEWEDKRPFDHVYFTGMVRDKQRRKMSKSLGNSPDAIALMDNFGADGVRFGMLMSSPAGGDLLFDEKLCEQGRNFCNKIWNATRLLQGWKTTDIPPADREILAIEWIKTRLTKLIKDTNKGYAEYRLSEVIMDMYSFVWNDYCSWFLEFIKPEYGEPLSARVKEEAIDLMETICSLLHPFMPFITEEIWHRIKERPAGEDCIVSTYPVSDVDYPTSYEAVEFAKEVISGVRDIRNKQGLKIKDALPLEWVRSETAETYFSTKGFRSLVMHLGYLESFTLTDQSEAGLGFIVGKEKLSVLVTQEVNVEELLEEKTKELQYQKGFVAAIDKKLQNERFVNNAPETVVQNEKKKWADGVERIRLLEEEISRIRS